MGSFVVLVLFQLIACDRLMDAEDEKNICVHIFIIFSPSSNF
jgi:hypothetical protein